VTPRASKPQVLRLNALRIEQTADVPLYVFGINGRLIPMFAAVEEANRTKEGVLSGYQRPRVKSHIAEIADYLRREGALLPNAIVVSFDSPVPFTASPGAIRSEWGVTGTVQIAIPGANQPKPALIVDGQQRVAALAQLDGSRDLPVVVVGFHASSDEMRREQFVLVNRTRPLPRDLLNELLPHISTHLPRGWKLRRTSAAVLEILRFDKKSPFHRRIRGLGAPADAASISQRALLNVIEKSIRRGGILSGYEGDVPTKIELVAMANTVKVFFLGVRNVWPEAWGGSPWSSRLVHGAGIHALGVLMEDVMDDVDATRPRAVQSVTRRLKRIESRCAWTSGRWPRLRREWDEIQNTSQDKKMLADYLLAEYRKRS
jgi:DGQHR domain-containing protein